MRTHTEQTKTTTSGLTVYYRDDSSEIVRSLDGGGISLTAPLDSDAYEIHGTSASGSDYVMPQSKIKRVIDNATGEPVCFGNSLMPGHPDYQVCEEGEGGSWG